MPVRTEVYNGKKVIIVDCSATGAKTIEEVKETTTAAARLIEACGQGNALVVTLVEGRQFSMELSEIMTDYTAHNRPFVKKSAVYPIEGLLKVLSNTVSVKSKRSFYVATSVDDAKKYVTSD